MNDRTSQGRDTPNEGTFERIGEQIGGAAARAMGRGAEIAGGMMGSMVDSMMSTLGDWWSSTDANSAAQSFDREEPGCRQHFETQSTSTGERAYDDVRPFYQFGYVASQNPSYRGRDFTEIEPDLQKAWGSADARDEWSDVRGFVDYGYTRDRMDRLDL